MFDFNVVPVAVHLGYKPVSHVRATSTINKHPANGKNNDKKLPTNVGRLLGGEDVKKSVLPLSTNPSFFVFLGTFSQKTYVHWTTEKPLKYLNKFICHLSCNKLCAHKYLNGESWLSYSLGWVICNIREKPLHLPVEVFSVFNIRNNEQSNRKMRRLLRLNPPLISNSNLHALDHAIKKNTNMTFLWISVCVQVFFKGV